MGNRKLPFGYTMERGEIIPHPEERNCVCMIFDEYQKGVSYNVLVARLEKNGVPYDTEKSWNKNMVARILENRRYMGEQSYPPIIKREQFNAVACLRAVKKGDTEKSYVSKTLRRVCEAKITPDIVSQVLSLMNGLIMHPELVQSPVDAMVETSEHILLRMKLGEALAQQPINEDEAKQLIYELASAEYTTISSNDYETERIRWLLHDAVLMDKLDEVLLEKCLAQVMIVTDRTVSLRLKNGQIIERSLFP